jgi:DNA-binding NarL/FixJ family response regulator
MYYCTIHMYYDNFTLMAGKIYIAIVDDKKSVSQALKEGLSRFDDFEVVLTAQNGQDFLAKLKETYQGAHPDIVLMDIDMPVMDGITAVLQTKIRYPNMQVLMLTIFDEDEKIFNAITAGADGYLLKDEPIEKIREAIIHLLEMEGAPMSPGIARRVLKLLGRPLSPLLPTVDNKTNNDDITLTEREQAILQLLVDGLGYKEIAVKLNISPNTVRNHISKIYKKLHINSRSQAQKIMLQGKK